jgi:hypothetical protein
MRIEECVAFGVFFKAERPQEAALMQLYKGDALLGDRPDPLPKGEDVFPSWKMKEHEELLDEIVRFGGSIGTLLDVGCFSGMFLRKTPESADSRLRASNQTRTHSCTSGICWDARW